MKNFNFHPLARIELNDARLYLNEESVELADRFVEAIDRTMTHIRRRPDGGRPTLSGCRLFEVARFPYRIIYQDRRDDIFIIAIAHIRRRPDKENLSSRPSRAST